MADDAVKQLLSKWTLDTSSWSKSVATAKKLIDDASSADAKRSTASNAATKEAIALLQKEIELQAKVATTKGGGSGVDSKKTAELSKQILLQKQAADQALAAIQTQIAAERLREQAAKSALAAQRLAAQEAMNIAKATMAAQKQAAFEAAEQKAKVQSLFKDAYQAQVDEVSQNKRLNVRPSNKKELADPPIVRPDNKRTVLNPANDVATNANAAAASAAEAEAVTSAEAFNALEQQRAALATGLTELQAAGGAAAESAVQANKAVTLSTDEATEAYRAQATAILELQRTTANVNETKKAIADGTYTGDGEARLAADLATQATARKALITENNVLIAQEKERVALLAEELAEQAAVPARHRQMLEEELANNATQSVPWYTRMFGGGGNQPPSGGSSAGASGYGGGNGHGTGNLIAVRGVAGAVMGRGGIRPLESLIAQSPILAGIAQIAFPVVGAAMFLNLLKDGYEAAKKMLKELRELPNVVMDGFGSMNASIAQSNDQLRVTDDNIKNATARLEHRPVNNLALAIDEARVKSDELYKSAIAAGSEVKKLLEDANVGKFQEIILSLQGQSGQLGAGLDQGVQDEFQKKNRAVTNAALNVKTASRNPDLYLDAKSKDASIVARKNAAQAAVDYANIGYQNALQQGISFADQELAKRAPKKVDRSNKEYRDIIGEPNTNQDTPAIIALRGLRENFAGRAETPDLEKQNLIDQNKEKADQEKKRQSEIALKDNRAQLDADKKANDDTLKVEKDAIQDLMDANESAYKTGSEDAKTYYDNKTKYAEQTFEATKKFIQAQQVLELRSLDIERKESDGAMTGKQYDLKRKAIISSSEGQQTDLDKTTKKEVSGYAVGQGQEIIKDYKAQEDTVLQIRLASLTAQTDAVKASFDEQTIDAEQYLSQQKAIISQEYIATMTSLEQKKVLNGKYSDENIALDKEEAAAYDKAQKAIQDITQNSFKTRFGYIQAVAGSKSGLASAQGALLNDPTSGSSLSARSGNISTQQTNSALELVQLQQLASQTVQYSSDWYQVQTRIAQVREEIQGLVNDQKNLNSLPQEDTGRAISGIGSATSGILTSKYGRGLQSAISGGGAAITAAPAQVKSFQDAGSIFGGSLSDGVDVFTKKLTSAVGAIGNFVTSIASAGSASAGALGGGLSGAGLGQAAGSAAQQAAPSGSALSGLGSAAGPLGALIGAGAGAILGGIMGQKQEEVEDDINQLNASYKQVQNAYGSNNASLATTISSLQNLIAQAQEDMAETKKGGSQFTQLIQQYNDQINQLENQQKQQMATLTNSLLVLGEASPYQDMLTSIQSILQQYTQFAGAASNATQLAQANQFLTQSLQQLGTTYSQQLLQDETTAVQDALQLNDLYSQRNQLQLQFFQQTQAIEGQGTLTRGVTQAQSKFSQLFTLDVNNQNQLDSINEQISMEQYKVQAEQQIFNLATTKQGLEMQLLGLQEQGINLDMARIAAMQNLLGVLSKTGFSITNLNNLNLSDPNTLITLLMGLLTSALNNGSGPAGIAGSNGGLLSTILGGAYSGNSNMGLAGFNGTPLV